MKVAFIGHSHHQATGSSRFMLEALKALGEVETYWSEDWRCDAAAELPPGLALCEAVVVWQVEAAALELARARHPNTTFFPMYDSCHAHPDSYWRRLAPLKVVCFSSTLHARLQRLGVRTRWAQFFPEVPAEPAGPAALSGYFWQRRDDLPWSAVHRLLGDSPFEAFTLHDAPDPGIGPIAPPSAADVARWNIRMTRWTPEPDRARAELRGHGVYFSPRLREGIGMSTLEALALGLLVVSPDRPTMNEYIASGVNGLLYDPDRPSALDFTDRESLGRCARQLALEGRARWEAQLPVLLALVARPAREVPVVAPLDSLRPAAQRAARSGWSRPSVTVAVVADGSPSAVRTTLQSVLTQDGAPLEVMIFAPPGGLALAEVPAGIATRELPDPATSAAWPAAAAAAAGEFVVVLRAGERFAGSDALTHALRGAPADVDLVLGHQVLERRGLEELVLTRGPPESLARLRAGALDWPWLRGLPAEPTPLWRTASLRDAGLRSELGPVAVIELWLRALREGARAHHAMVPLVKLPARLDSMRRRGNLLQTLRPVLLAHAGDRRAAEEALRRMARGVAEGDLHEIGAPDLLLRLPALPGAARELKRRLRAWRARRRAW